MIQKHLSDYNIDTIDFIVLKEYYIKVNNCQLTERRMSMKIFKKILCTFLVVIMCLTAAPLQGFVGIEFPEINT